MGLRILFCGEEFPAVAGRQLTIGRSGDVEIDDNPYLHRSFLVVLEERGLWWLSNVGSRLTATVADSEGRFQAWLAPGARIPLALSRSWSGSLPVRRPMTSRSSWKTRPVSR